MAHLWATSDSVPRSQALGNPQAAGVMLPAGPFVILSSRSEALETPQAAGAMLPAGPFVGHF